ncbi:hypothetical protein scyTo_0016521, partial [Scyliorhinus torazame]|nr:hypothetical protein [Scyliorhinus torazame]
PPETANKSRSITGEIQLQMNYDKHIGNLIVHVLQARNLAPRDNNGYSDPFVKVYLLPGRGVENKRRTKHVQKSINPEWNQTVIYKSISMEQIKKKTLEVTVWDYDRFSSNDFLGEVLIDLSNTSHFDNTLRWYLLKDQAESIDHAKPHSGQSSQQSPKHSVIKSRSHGIFPDPSKEMHVPTIEKSQSSPVSSKSSSEGHLRSHGPSRSQSKTSVTQTHLEDAGVAIAAAEAAVQQLRLQPTHKSGQAQNHARKHRHSIAGVPIQRTQSDNLPSPANENKDQSQLAIRKVMSEGSPKPDGGFSQEECDLNVASAPENASDQLKITPLLNLTRQQALEFFNLFEFSADEDKNKYSMVLWRCPFVKNFYECYMLKDRLQFRDKFVASEITDLKLRAQSGNFASGSESMLRDKVVFRINDEQLHEKMLSKLVLSIEDAINMCKINKQTSSEYAEFVVQEKSTKSINVVDAINAVLQQRKLPVAILMVTSRA